VQGNLAILPQALATDFLRFCQLNPKPCPLIGTSAPGDPRVPELGEDLDIRTDLPRYRVWKNGELVAEPEDVREFWRDDLVSFVIGCSFSFEEALAAEGIELRHITRGCNVPMYRTSIATNRAGPFHGPMVVSMRPMTPRDAIRSRTSSGSPPSGDSAPSESAARFIRSPGASEAVRRDAALSLAKHPADGANEEREYRAANDRFNDVRRRATELIRKVNNGRPFTDINYVFPTFVTTHAPAGVVGLIIAAIFAAAMSSIAAERKAACAALLVLQGDNDIRRKKRRRSST
jgi:hypothetical protein